MAAQREEMEARADRCLRRGELTEALRLYQELVRLHPTDPGLTQKLAQLQESVDPRELTSAKLPAAEDNGRLPPSTPEQEGERLFTLGDYAGAAAAYRRALRDKPDSVLIRERLVELYQLARTAPSHSPTDCPLPDQPEPLLRALLDRIAARKRVRLT
jgi:tetratricopeptide (TPR) repeat protein